MKIVKKIQLKIVIFTAVKNRCILHGRVFVMQRFLIPSGRPVNLYRTGVFNRNRGESNGFCFQLTSC